MVVEHSFVTTLDAPQAMHAAMMFLGQRGFITAAGHAFQVGGPAGLTAEQTPSLDLQRGRTRASRAKNVLELPQRVRIHWDRGRVTVALSIEANAVWGGSQWSFAPVITALTSSTGNPKKMKLHARLLTSIAMGLEQLLAYGQPPERAAMDWQMAEAACLDAARRRRNRNILILVLLFLFVAGMIALVVIATQR